ncbi:unnamed protein product [Dibothriocephalus latus]|uniref:Uncharacterized protein n=1 Tax=Dibothriocephalus latus TaxID=60516 RepID=A0A3P6VD19_DIBLA|nr:unnamed protein product [Dibothriocephalus latus]
MTNSKCHTCSNNATARSKAAFCTLCKQWVHIKWAKIAPEIYEVLKKYDSERLFPFFSTYKISFGDKDEADTNTDSQEEAPEQGSDQSEIEKTDSASNEQNDRKKALLSSNVPESEEVNAETLVDHDSKELSAIIPKMLDPSGGRVSMVQLFRLGAKPTEGGRPRPLKAAFKSEQTPKLLLTRGWRFKDLGDQDTGQRELIALADNLEKPGPPTQHNGQHDTGRLQEYSRLGRYHSRRPRNPRTINFGGTQGSGTTMDVQKSIHVLVHAVIPVWIVRLVPVYEKRDDQYRICTTAGVKNGARSEGLTYPEGCETLDLFALEF